MAISSITWWTVGYGGYDMHVVRNTTAIPSEELTKSIVVYDSTLSGGYILLHDLLFPVGTLDTVTQAVRDSITSYSFLPNTVGAVDTNATNSILDVSVDTANGKVTPADYSGTSTDNYLKNFSFIITASFVIGATTLKLRIRCHVHDSVTGAWLTPSNLTVRPDADKFRFSLLAQFSDEVMGDISRHPGISWTVEKDNNPTTDITITSQGELTVATTVTAGTSGFTVLATLPGYVNNTSGSISVPEAELTIAESWRTAAAVPDPVLISNNGTVIQPGKEKFKTAPNFLFIANGFHEDDRGDFETFCNDIRVQFSTQGNLSPWNHLSPDVNFWRFFLPSRERGTTALNELICFKILNDSTITSPYGPSSAPDAIKEVLRSKEVYFDYVDAFLRGGSTPFYDYEIDDTKNPRTPNSGFYKRRAEGPITRQANPVADFTKHQLLLKELVAIVGFPTTFDKEEAPATLRANKWSLFTVELEVSGVRQLISHPLTTEGQTLPIGDEPNVTNDLFECWTRCWKRHLPEEFDNEFGIASGGRPSVDNELPHHQLTFHPFRAQRIFQINDLLSNASDKIDSTAHRWILYQDTPPTYTIKPDFGTVAFLCGGSRFAGANTPLPNAYNVSQLIATSMVDGADMDYDFTVIGSAGTSAKVALTPKAIPKAANFSTMGVIAHEFSHSYALFDEYGAASPPIDPYYQTVINNSLNLQLENTNLRPDADHLNANHVKWRFMRYEKAGVLQINSTVNTSNSAHHDLTLKKEDAALFVQHEKVRLTNYMFYTPVDLQAPPPFLSEELTIESITPIGEQSVVVVSGPMNIAHYLAGSRLVKTVPTRFRGKGTISSSGANVTGTSTAFLSEIATSFEIIVGNESRYVLSIANDTSLEVYNSFSTSLSGATYEVQPYGRVFGLTGTITSTGVSLTGTGTAFLTELRVGSLIIEYTGGAKVRKVVSIANDTSLTMDSDFSSEVSGVAVSHVPPIYHAELLSDIIRRFMTSNVRTLTSDPDSETWCTPPAPQAYGDMQTPKPNVLVDSASPTPNPLLPRLSQPGNKMELVGLFAGGSNYGCGVYHPTGFCMMRNDLHTTRLYCPVCKYVIVEIINPGRHKLIDGEYAPKYPKL